MGAGDLTSIRVCEHKHCYKWSTKTCHATYKRLSRLLRRAKGLSYYEASFENQIKRVKRQKKYRKKNREKWGRPDLSFDDRIDKEIVIGVE